MPFTIPDFRRVTPEESSPYNNLISRALQQYQQGVKSAYLPRSLEADIFHKQISPLANIAISPLAQLLPGESRQAIANLISHGLANMGYGGGAQSQQTHGGLLNGIGRLFGMQQPVNTEQMQEPGLDHTEQVRRGYTTRVEAPAFEIPYHSGTTRTTEEGGEVTQPTSGTVEEAQHAITNLQAADIVVPQITQAAQAFLSIPARGRQQFINEIKAEADKVGLTKLSPSEREMLSNFNILTNLQDEYKNILRKNGATAQEANNAVNIKPNDNYETYSKRLNTTLALSRKLAEQHKQNISSKGISLSKSSSEAPPTEPKNGMRLMEAPDGSQAFVPLDKVSEYKKLYKLKDVD